MAVKESSQRAIIDQQYVQIADLQKANNKLREELFERVSQALLSQVYHSLMEHHRNPPRRSLLTMLESATR
jgi:hypothetical protein